MPVMSLSASSERLAGVLDLSEEFSALRLRSATAVEEMRLSMARHGQLTPLTVYETKGALAVIDGFKRLHAARVLELDTLKVVALTLGPVEAKAAILALNASCRLSEIEEAWLVRSMVREHHLSQPEIGRVLCRDKSWVCRRLALVESLDESLQADLRLGVVSASCARELARLPRGNQKKAADVVLGRGLTAHQTARLVQALILCADDREKDAVLGDFDACTKHVLGPRPRTPAEQMMADAALMSRTAGRLQARLLEAPLSVLGEAAAALVKDALCELHPVLVALSSTVECIQRGT